MDPFNLSGGKISVVIPVFNGELYVGEAIASAVRQGELVAEIIVVDDGSTDATEKVVRAITDCRIRYVRQERAGAAAARNRGVSLANGYYLAFLDADDLWLDDKLALQLDCLERGEGELAFALIDEFVSPDLDFPVAAQLKPRPGPLPGISSTMLMVSRRDFDRVGGFDPKWTVGEFIDWYSRARELELRPVVVPKTLGLRRLHKSNTGRSNHDQRNQYAQVMKHAIDRRRVNRNAQ